MTLSITSEPVPLRADPDGTVRVGGTRVLLDVVVSAFRQGASAEQVVDQYPDLDLADVYAVIAYYLRHGREVDAYLSARRDQAVRLREEIEARLDPRGIRDRLLARRARKG
jgi:uncharacterized protein (DUF433 family)